ncbi:MAG TPA: bifunctional DNA primase/polymerase, partial [Lacunisphaera sp.]|nr:bifunctional DNA primase/polymerase [Lacunisphaera sp.]
YHLFFKHPACATSPKITPWHSKLEFRGDRGIVVVPPSKHRSGNRYAWEAGKSPEEIALPELPTDILNALQEKARRAPSTNGHGPVELTEPRANRSPRAIDASPSTLAFLSGRLANASGWNQRLFDAACDLKARGMPYEQALPLLIQGAVPWNDKERKGAEDTIQSAYSQDRTPARY